MIRIIGPRNGRRRIKMEIVEITDPVELAARKRGLEQWRRNVAWVNAHPEVVYADVNRGKCVCIAGQEVFVADDPLEAHRLAKLAHPDDEGEFNLTIPIERAPRIY